MTERDVSATVRRFERHGAYERAGETTLELTTTTFEGEVGLRPTETGVEYAVTARVPTLDAAVEGETVAPVVEDGWYETLERRVADAAGVARTDGVEGPAVSRGGETVAVELSFESDDAERAAADAKALIDYVEGTWVEGVVPGYEYGDPAGRLLQQASQDDDGARRGGTPL